MNVEEIKSVLKEQREDAENLMSRAIPRDVPKEELLTNLSIPNVLAILGVRRSGKSTLSLLLLKDKNFAYVDFDDERLINLKSDDLHIVEQAIYELYGNVDYILFDEIQNIQGWEPFVSRLRKTKRIILTGSNSKLLSGELATSLTGRHVDFTLFPFSFKEFLRFKRVNYSEPLTTRERAEIKNYLREYMSIGGFPEALLLNSRQIVNSIYNDILFKDVVQRLKIKRISKFKDFSSAVISLYSSEISLNRIARMLRIDYKTVDEWFYGLTSSYLIYSVERYTGKLSRIAENKKVYVVDMGIIQEVSIKKDMGRLMENLVAIHLLRKNQNKGVYFVKGEDYEVDFLDEKNGELIQVTYDEEGIKERELSALTKASSLLGFKPKIVTWDMEEIMDYNGKKIELEPLWKFLLK
ncbi:AAA family ATPase [Acidianus hospitalis]|uniref:AAA family ATPase n=1 Tax=Acidianus hospitalis TaxID=563177 RepID=A0A2T9X8N7_9CREN|nr:AAA family ATPase [Acidianus hospitalis]